MASTTVDSANDEKKVISDQDPEFGRTGRAPTPDSRSGSIRDVETTGPNGIPSAPDDAGSSLPFSKARCIALVATVTGACFLNVSTTQGDRTL